VPDEVVIEFLTYARKLSTDSKADTPSLGMSPVKPPLGISPGSVEVVGAPLVEISPGAVVSVPAGAGAPTDGISPARTEEETAHNRAIVIKNRFMSFLLLSGDARFLTWKE